MAGKKASLEWEEIAKWILVLALVIIILIIIGSITGATNKLWETFANLFRFGR